MPRFIIDPDAKIRSYNPNPPREFSRRDWDRFGNFVTANFEWRNPRSSSSAAAIKGPSWMEKELASSNRNGIDIGPKQRKLYLLKSIKEFAADALTQSAATFELKLTWCAARVGHRFERDDRGRIHVHDTYGGRKFVIKGWLVEAYNKPLEAVEQSYDKSLKLVQQSWNERAVYNRKIYGKGKWQAPDLDVAKRITRPEISIPRCHPDWMEPNAPAVGSRLSIVMRVALMIKHLRHQLLSGVAARHFLAAITQTEVTEIRKVRTQMEIVENEFRPKAHQLMEELCSLLREVLGQGSSDQLKDTMTEYLAEITNIRMIMESNVTTMKELMQGIQRSQNALTSQEKMVTDISWIRAQLDRPVFEE